MKIIDFHSSLPGADDFTVTYAGSSVSGAVVTSGDSPGGTPAQAYPYAFTTLIRKTLFVSFRCLPAGTVKTSVANTMIELPFTITVNTDGTYTYNILVPGGYTFYWLIYGSKVVDTLKHSELSVGTVGSTISHVRELNVLIANAGTSAITFVNTTGNTIAYTNPSTGSYVLTSNNAMFASTKVSAHVQLEGGVGITDPITVLFSYQSPTVVQIDLSKANGTGIAAPARIFLNLKIYP